MRHMLILAFLVSVFGQTHCIRDEQEHLRKTFIRQCEQRRTPPGGGTRKVVYAEHENLELSCDEIVQKLHQRCYSESQKESRTMVSIHMYVGCMHNNKLLF